MGTEKSLLTWNDVKHRLYVDDGYIRGPSTIALPVGVSDQDEIIAGQLSAGPTGHAGLFGAVGSGKSTALRWMLCSIMKRYPNATISYIDGKGVELKSWQTESGFVFPYTGIMRCLSTHSDWTRVLWELCGRVDAKDEKSYPEIVVMDDVDQYTAVMTDDEISTLQHIVDSGPEKGVHLLYTSQWCSRESNRDRGLKDMRTWDVRCVTRCTESFSEFYLEDVAGAKTRKYGDIVLRANSDIIKLKVPYVDYHIVKRGAVYE